MNNSITSRKRTRAKKNFSNVFNWEAFLLIIGSTIEWTDTHLYLAPVVYSDDGKISGDVAQRPGLISYSPMV